MNMTLAEALKHPRPHPARTIVYMLVSFVFRLLQFVLIVAGMTIGNAMKSGVVGAARLFFTACDLKASAA